ncbi:MAG: DUF4258 domain-containing protein [Geitlerinemataceae cyanobacterium]
MKIQWTRHAEERQRQWQQRLGITADDVESVLTDPEEVVPEGDVLVAQSRYGDGLLRVVFAEVGSATRIITLYWTNQVKRYWQGETR